jgi:hypothetical protein
LFERIKCVDSPCWRLWSFIVLLASLVLLVILVLGVLRPVDWPSLDLAFDWLWLLWILNK